MILLVASAEHTIAKYDGNIGARNLGRLVSPKYCQKMDATITSRRPWAADNDCFSGLDPDAYLSMLKRLPTEGCLFVTVPDVVANHDATLKLWDEWSPKVKAKGLPAAFVLQDGCHTYSDVPDDADAVFVGGTTEYKLSFNVQAIILESKRRGQWVHMGRVSTQRRIRYAQSVGCDSFDSSKFSKWSELEIPWALRMLSTSAYQQSLISDVIPHEPLGPR